MKFSVEPDLQFFERFVNEIEPNKPIMMLNLLRFRDQADYEKHADSHAPCTGKAAYKRYAKSVLPLMLEVGGVPIWMGKVRQTVIAPVGEGWDEAFLVAYPSRQAFIKMVSTDTYRTIMVHRTAALLDSRLIETHPKALPKSVLKLIGMGLKVKSWVFPRK